MGKRILIFNHGGSKNHGCEAIVRTVTDLLAGDSEITLMSEAPGEDFYYEINKIVNKIIPAKEAIKKDLSFIKAYISLKTNGDYTVMDALPFQNAVKKLDFYDLAISIGGDVYCYDNYHLYISIHQMIRKKAKETILLGCSIEADRFKDEQFLTDIKSYDKIFARESLTYQLLKDNQVSNVYFMPDSAFTLKRQEIDMDEKVKGSIGINVSPLVSSRGKDNSIVYENYRYLIKMILDKTEKNISLIPHVIWDGNDDRTILRDLYNEFPDTGRIVMIEDHNCMELKQIISQCSYFIGARTHATIAAYSSCVPTLVVGYSIKSKGIARDLFGTEEKYVVPVQELKNEDDLWNAFFYVMNNGGDIRKHLERSISSYSDQYNYFEEIAQ